MVDKIKKILELIIGYGIIVILLISFISIISILGGGVLGVFGFEYNSIKSIIIFFSMVAILGFPLEILVLYFSKMLLAVDKINIKLAKIIFIILDTCSTMLIISLVDHLMVSISASIISTFIISLIIAFSSVNDLDK